MPRAKKRPRVISQNLQAVSTSPPHSAIQDFPAEIWGRIFSEACIDEGRTGRSLSLVSKYVHDVSRPYKYQCLMVEEHQLRPLATTLKKLPPNFRRVRHLFLSSARWGGWGENQFFTTDKNRLLILVSPTLQTLEVGSNFAHLHLTFQMPALLELTVHGDALFNRLPTRTVISYPRLQRLHVAHCSWIPLGGLLPVLEKVAPSTRELRVSVSEVSTSERIGAEFQAAFGKSNASHSKKTAPFSALQKIIFQPSITSRYYPYQISLTLTEVCRRICETDSRFVLLIEDPAFRTHSTCQVDITKRLWRDRQAGGRDCWNPIEDELDTRGKLAG